MPELIDFESRQWIIPLIVVAALLSLWLVLRIRRRRGSAFEAALSQISFDRIENLIIPSADGGEILLDYLILTSRGLLILDVKQVEGKVFGGDKMKEWTVMSDMRRYTFSNPQTALYDRIAAVSEIVLYAPVHGRILFLEGAEFTKGVPGMVCTLEELVEEFLEDEGYAVTATVEGYREHWDMLRARAIGVSSPAT